MKFLIFLAFVIGASSATFASAKSLSDQDPSIIQLVNNLESALAAPTEFEILLTPNPMLNRLKHLKLPTEWSNIPKLEVAAALLTEKYRKEHALYRSPTGDLWFSQGSFGTVLPPESIKLKDGTFDRLFHTHPARGKAIPSGPDIQNNIGKSSDVINMTGQKCTMLPDGSVGPQKTVFVPSKYTSEPSAETNKLDYEIEVLASRYDYFETLKLYLAVHPEQKAVIKAEFESLKVNWKSLKPIKHSSIPGNGSETFAETVQKEIDALNVK